MYERCPRRRGRTVRKRETLAPVHCGAGRRPQGSAETAPPSQRCPQCGGRNDKACGNRSPGIETGPSLLAYPGSVSAPAHTAHLCPASSVHTDRWLLRGLTVTGSCSPRGPRPSQAPMDQSLPGHPTGWQEATRAQGWTRSLRGHSPAGDRQSRRHSTQDSGWRAAPSA